MSLLFAVFPEVAQKQCHILESGVRDDLWSLEAREAQRMYLRRSRESVPEISSRAGRVTVFCAPRAIRRHSFWNLSSRRRTALGAVDRTREPYSRIGRIQEL
jgi:hypothetical protein